MPRARNWGMMRLRQTLTRPSFEQLRTELGQVKTGKPRRKPVPQGTPRFLTYHDSLTTDLLVGAGRKGLGKSYGSHRGASRYLYWQYREYEPPWRTKLWAEWWGEYHPNTYAQWVGASITAAFAEIALALQSHHGRYKLRCANRQATGTLT